MRVAIDAVGRVVVPKPLRSERGITGEAELELVARDGVIEMTVADVPARIADHNGTPVIEPAGAMNTLTAEDARAAIDRVRR